MTDLHKRLAHWKAMSRPAASTLEGVDPLWLEQGRADLALDALAEVLDRYAVIAECPDYGPPPEHYTTARTILRELRGATSGEGSTGDE